MNRIKVLRQALFGGYRKKDVKGYIEELSTALNDKQTAYELKIAQLELESTENRKQLALLEKEKQAKQRQYAAISAQVQALQQEKSALQAQLTEQEERMHTLNEEFDRQLADNAKLTAKMRCIQEKSEKYDDLNDQIGGIVLNAHSYANQVIESAKQEATALAIDSLENMSNISLQVSEINQEFHVVGDKVGNYVSQMNLLLTQLTDEIETAVNKIKPATSSQQVKNLTNAATDTTFSRPSIFDAPLPEDGGNSKKVRIKVKPDELSSLSTNDKPRNPIVFS